MTVAPIGNVVAYVPVHLGMNPLLATPLEGPSVLERTLARILEITSVERVWIVAPDDPRHRAEAERFSSDRIGVFFGPTALDERILTFIEAHPSHYYFRALPSQALLHPALNDEVIRRTVPEEREFGYGVPGVGLFGEVIERWRLSALVRETGGAPTIRDLLQPGRQAPGSFYALSHHAIREAGCEFVFASAWDFFIRTERDLARAARVLREGFTAEVLEHTYTAADRTHSTEDDATFQLCADMALRYLEPRPGETILDLGAGRGRIAALLAGSGLRVIGLDKSRELVEEAIRANEGNGNEFHACDLAAGIPLADGSVECVLSIGFLQYISPWRVEELIRECRRVVKPGGRVAHLNVPDRLKLAQIEDPLERLVKRHPDAVFRDGSFAHDGVALVQLARALGFRSARSTDAEYIDSRIDYRMNILLER